MLVREICRRKHEDVVKRRRERMKAVEGKIYLSHHQVALCRTGDFPPDRTPHRDPRLRLGLGDVPPAIGRRRENPARSRRAHFPDQHS